MFSVPTIHLSIRHFFVDCHNVNKRPNFTNFTTTNFKYVIVIGITNKEKFAI